MRNLVFNGSDPREHFKNFTYLNMNLETAQRRLQQYFEWNPFGHRGNVKTSYRLIFKEIVEKLVK